MRDFQDTDWLVSLIKKVCLLIPVVGRKKSKLRYVHHKKEEWKGASCVESPGTPPRSGVKSDHILAWQKSCYTASGLKIEI